MSMLLGTARRPAEWWAVEIVEDAHASQLSERYEISERITTSPFPGYDLKARAFLFLLWDANDYMSARVQPPSAAQV